MAQVTRDFARIMLEQCESGEFPHLTVWEMKQLLIAFLDRESIRHELLQVHRVLMCVGTADRPTDNDTYVVRGVKDIAARLTKLMDQTKHG